MSETQESMPIREQVKTVRCRCVILYDGMQDRCGASTSDPDSPLCEGCRHRHFGGTDLEPGATFRMAPS